MGTRYFHSREPKDSRIKWEKVPKEQSSAILKKINDDSKLSPIAVIFMMGSIGFIIMLSVFIFTLEPNDRPPIWFSAFFLLFCLFFLSILIIPIVQPYLFPIKNKDLWVFYAKCSDVSLYSAGSDRSHYCAYFQQGGIHIALKITGYECREKIPVGKKYMFYKFNDRTKNPFRAIPVEENETDKEQDQIEDTRDFNS